MKLQFSIKVIFMLFFSCSVQAEIGLGSPAAPVTIIEYGSYTCGYCVRFHREVLPLIESFYVETGKVHYIYHEYPIDTAATHGAVAVQCTNSTYQYALHNALYNSVENWSKSDDINAAIINIALTLGIDAEPFSSCLNDPQRTLSVKNAKEEAIFNHDVSVTPTFFINNKVIRGMQEFNEMEVLIENAINH